LIQSEANLRWGPPTIVPTPAIVTSMTCFRLFGKIAQEFVRRARGGLIAII
jgi:hypothetical protein